MKKIYFIISIFALMFMSCEVLDVDPQHSIPADDAIKNRNDVLRAITGCYDAFQAAGYYGRNYVVVGDLPADNLTWTGTTAGYNQMDNNSILSDNVIVEGIWSSIYTALNRINNVIDRIPHVDDLTDAQASEFLGELYFLRALAHFDLVRLYGGIPLRTGPVTPEESSLNVGRSSVEAVYQQIFADLEFAESRITASIVRGKASLAAVHALKARASLYFYNYSQTGSYLDTAIQASTAVINNYGLSLEDDFAYLFSGSNNSESVFEIEFNEQDRNRMGEYFFPTDLSGRYEFAPTENFVDAFSTADQRLEASIAFSGTEPYSIKYNDIETGTDNIYVFRLAEMHLIRAEANALKGAPAEDILTDLNAVRERAGLLPATSTNLDVLLADIEDQRRKEFAFEGHRWFDLVRTQRAVDVLEGVEHINQTLFPIPLNEILANDAIDNNDQNPGY